MNKKLKLLTISLLIVALSTGIYTATAWYIPKPASIELSPTSGFATTITGEDFDDNKDITVYWNNVEIPFVGNSKTDHHGNLIVMITAPTTEPCTYTIKVRAGYEFATASFTVPDTTGPQGPQGQQGATGATGATGAQGNQGPPGTTITFSPASSQVNGLMIGQTTPDTTLIPPLGTLYLDTVKGELWQYTTKATPFGGATMYTTGWFTIYTFNK